MTSTVVALAVGGDDAVGLDPLDRVGDQVHVVALAACVAQMPLSSSIRLARGGYVGHHLCRAARACRANCELEVHRQQGAQLVAAGADRPPVAGGQSGSTSAAGSMPSASRQNSQNRYHWL